MQKKAFTLIEILVVVTIIGILLSTAIISYGSLSKSSRDARRKTDLEQIRAALEMWRSSEPLANGQYPDYPEADCSGLNDGAIPNFWEYLPQIPADPKAASGPLYKCESTLTGYSLYSTLELDTSGNICGGSGDCGGADFPCKYAVGPYGKTCGP